MRLARLMLLSAWIFLVGCDPVAEERIVLALPATNELDAVKSAVMAIEAVLTQKGFTTTHNTNSELVAIYAGAGRLGCLVHHRAGKVEVLFTEMGKFKSRPEAVEARESIREKLGTTFGKDKLSQ